jgi:hypothetical protein
MSSVDKPGKSGTITATLSPGSANGTGARSKLFQGSAAGAWTKRRWFDLRNGYGFYISIFLGLVNFCLLFSVKFPSLNPYIFVPLIGAVAAVSATGIGYVHRKTQLRTDLDSVFEQSHLLARINEIQLKAILGKATDEEIAWALNLLSAIRNNQA